MKACNIQEMMEGSQSQICVFHQACLSAAQNFIYVITKKEQKIIADKYKEKMRVRAVLLVVEKQTSNFSNSETS